MRIAILVKQIPAFESMALGADGRLVRDSVALEMSAYCRRAVSEGVALARDDPASTTTVFSLGPPSALDVIREAIGWGVDAGVLLSDRAFAGSDTVATVQILAAALAAYGPFDLVLVGRNSLDSDTGQVGPGVAELLGWGFLGSVKALKITDDRAVATCEEDDGESERIGSLPLVVATAERLIEPCKVPPERWPAADDPRVSILGAARFGGGPWGAAASPTTVGEVRVRHTDRERVILEGPATETAVIACGLLEVRGALQGPGVDRSPTVPLSPTRTAATRAIAVVVEPDRPSLARELLGEANALAAEVDAVVVAFTVGAPDTALLSAWGADEIEALEGEELRERDIAVGVAGLVRARAYWALLIGSTAWGREVAARVSARLAVGLTGDALEFTVDRGDPRALVAWKSALGGQLLAAIRSSTEPQMATVRPGALPLRTARTAQPVTVRTTGCTPLGGVATLGVDRNDDFEELERATHVVAVGAGVSPTEHEAIRALATTLGATVAATRRVTDKGWMPRSRQVGITGRSIHPHLYVAIGVSGKFNHTVGVRAAGTILAINADRSAPIFDACDIGIVGDWREVVPFLNDAIAAIGHQT